MGNTKKHREFGIQAESQVVLEFYHRLVCLLSFPPGELFQINCSSYLAGDQKQGPVTQATKGMSQIACRQRELVMNSLQAKKSASPKGSAKYPWRKPLWWNHKGLVNCRRNPTEGNLLHAFKVLVCGKKKKKDGAMVQGSIICIRWGQYENGRNTNQMLSFCRCWDMRRLRWSLSVLMFSPARRSPIEEPKAISGGVETGVS